MPVKVFLLVDNADNWPADDESQVTAILASLEFLQVVKLNEQSNTKSYNRMYELAVKETGQLVLFVEDDYLWRIESITELVKAYQKLDVDYLTPYDHPVRYDKEYFAGADWPHWHTELLTTGSWHFRSHESTCMTFLASVSVLKEDQAMHMIYSKPENKVPNDRELFRNLQGLGKYSAQTKKRLLLGPVPSLATHLHLPYLAPAVDWESIAKQYNT